MVNVLFGLHAVFIAYSGYRSIKCLVQHYSVGGYVTAPGVSPNFAQEGGGVATCMPKSSPTLADQPLACVLQVLACSQNRDIFTGLSIGNNLHSLDLHWISDPPQSPLVCAPTHPPACTLHQGKHRLTYYVLVLWSKVGKRDIANYME